MGTTSNRDYYADLELGQGAEEAEIKRAYRKLALKYHPDRHPGREHEFNPKFLVIQEAHDVLTDPEQRAKYDASRRSTSRYPAASGVRGNPWSHVSTQFPVPPKRNPAPPRGGATSGADRWSGRFAPGTAPTARQSAASEAQTKKNAAKAFENMRKEKAQASARKAAAPPPPPPRTEAQKQRAKDSFGNRKATGYQPRGSAADEPQVKSNNYFTTRDSERPVPEPPKAQPAAQSVPQAAPMADPLSQFRDNSDTRTASPYASHGGERTNPFEDETPVRKRASTQGFTEKTPGQQENSTSSANPGVPPNQDEETPTRKPRREHSIFNLDNSGGSQPQKSKNTSSENIDTMFANNQNGAWQFTAGGSNATTGSVSRARSAGAARRRSPNARPSMPQMAASDSGQPGPRSEGGFNAENWANKFGSQTFTPQPTGSPTKSTRTVPKKTRSMTSASTQPESVTILDSSDDEDNIKWPGRKGQTNNTTGSPQAMDIDTPPPSAGAQKNGARSIPVEPTRPEWRSGDLDSANGNPEQKGIEIEVPKANQGSEDMDEFAANFAEFKNVPPFAQQASGFKSMNDLKDNLPFESKPSEQIPIEKEKTNGFQPLAFPSAPEAPRLPPTMAIAGIKPTGGAWDKYVRDFEEYMREWDAFDKQVTDHFTARLADVQRIRDQKGYAFLRSRGGEACIEYYNAVRQDNDVREKWHQACGEHERHLKEFLDFRERMRS